MGYPKYRSLAGSPTTVTRLRPASLAPIRLRPRTRLPRRTPTRHRQVNTVFEADSEHPLTAGITVKAHFD
jgi:hypothetical protein